MTISHVHCRVKDLLVAVEWFTSKCGVVPSFSDVRMAVLAFRSEPLDRDEQILHPAVDMRDRHKRPLFGTADLAKTGCTLRTVFAAG